MRAAVLERFGEPLALREVAEPEPGEGEVLVRVRAVGLCGTDLKLRAGQLPGVEPPVIPGHEVAGEVVVGEGLEAGRPVAVYLYEPCGRCRWCRAGRHALCPTAGRVGRNRDGGLAELIVVRAENALPAEGVEPAAAAVAMDAVTTSWRALRRRAELAEGEAALIVGAGGVGLHAVQVAAHLGARVAALDPDPAARARARELGAELAVEPGEEGAVAEWSGGGVDVALEASGRPQGLRAALGCLIRGGRVVCCGYAAGGVHAIASQRLVLDEISVLGSRAGSREDAREALAAVAGGAVVPVLAGRLPLERVNEALDAIAAGGRAGRLVVEPG